MRNFVYWWNILISRVSNFIWPNWLSILQRFCEVSGVGKKWEFWLPLRSSSGRRRLRAVRRPPPLPGDSQNPHFFAAPLTSKKSWKYRPRGKKKSPFQKKNIPKTKISFNGNTIFCQKSSLILHIFASYNSSFKFENCV